VVRLNSLFVAGFGARGMTMSQLINARFSIGASLGPLVVGWWGRPSDRIFGAVAMLALTLFPLCVLADRRGRMIATAEAKPDAPARQGFGVTLGIRAPSTLSAPRLKRPSLTASRTRGTLAAGPMTTSPVEPRRGVHCDVHPTADLGS
jgi:hypothetical protein